jgi:hypothetical protein
MSDKHTIDTGAAPITGTFTMTMPAPNGAQLQIQGYLYAGEAEESVNTRMDLCRDALRRQQDILERPVLEEKLAMLVRTEEQIQHAYLELLEQKKRKSLPSQQEQNLKNYPVQLKQLREEIAKAHAKLGVPEWLEGKAG